MFASCILFADVPGVSTTGTVLQIECTKKKTTKNAAGTQRVFGWSTTRHLHSAKKNNKKHSLNTRGLGVDH